MFKIYCAGYELMESPLCRLWSIERPILDASRELDTKVSKSLYIKIN